MVILASIFNSQDIISLITSIIDVFVIIVIGISVSFSMLSLLKTGIKSILFTFNSSKGHSKEKEKEESEQITIRRKVAKENFINGLLLALELESANAVLKLGVFTSILTGTIISSATTIFDMNNFIFFVGILSVRIAINQTVKRFNI